MRNTQFIFLSLLFLGMVSANLFGCDPKGTFEKIVSKVREPKIPIQKLTLAQRAEWGATQRHPAFAADMNEIMAMAWDQNEAGFLGGKNDRDYDGLVDAFLRTGLDIEAKDAKGHTALMHAFLGANHYLVRALVKRGARFDHVDYEGRDLGDLILEFQPPAWVDKVPREEARKTAYSNGLFQGRYIFPKVRDHLWKGEFEELDKLFAQGMSLDLRDIDRKSLYESWHADVPFSKKLAATKYLADKGVKFAGTLREVTDVEIARVLLDHGADINEKHYGFTVIHSFMWNGKEAMRNFLIDRGADLRVIGPDGSTPFMKIGNILDTGEAKRAIEKMLQKDPGCIRVHGNNIEPLIRAFSWRQPKLVPWVEQKFKESAAVMP